MIVYKEDCEVDGARQEIAIFYASQYFIFKTVHENSLNNIIL